LRLDPKIARRQILSLRTALVALTIVLTSTVARAQTTPHNVILFVPDGLRALKVTPETAPTMAAIRDRGVNFEDPHAIFPTFTTTNASEFATGHGLGDTGDFSNTWQCRRPCSRAILRIVSSSR
jgi:predicted AlkP superfamily pyrophosphatase or phosphodiesterase